MASDLTRYTHWQGPEPDADGEWVRASEAEAALAEKDREIAVLEAESEIRRHHLSLALAREVKLEAKLAVFRIREHRIPDRAVKQIKAADALADALEAWDAGKANPNDLWDARSAYRAVVN